MNEPLSSAVAKHGPPQFAYDTGDGRRAFGWVMNGAVVMPGTATTTGTMIGRSFYGTTTMSPSVASNYSCVYTVYATRAWTDIQGPAAWMIVGYEKPNLMCE